MNSKLNEYAITKDGKDCEDLPFDTVVGYSLARETVREMSDRFPKFKWGTRSLGKDYIVDKK